MHWIVPCPAKLNLFLAVGPVDARGYHPLRTIFQAVGLFDQLEIRVSDRNEVLCDDPSVPKENTVSRTLRLLAEVVDLPPLSITIRKQIPMQSGLGGGSSDAAGLIRAAAMISKGIPHAEMFGLAQTIGADVPFFLVGGLARAEGYGERLTPLEDGATAHFVIAKPDHGSDTSEAFRRLDAASYEWRQFPDRDEAYNDFERVADCGSTDLVERLLVNGASSAMMTGSGSAVFGRFASEPEALKAAERMASEGVGFVRVVRSLTRAESLAVHSAAD